MRAMVRSEYGPPEVLSAGEVPTPEPGEGEVRVRVHAAGLNPADRFVLLGSPFVVRFFDGGLRRPRKRVIGADFAGRVDAVGPGAGDLAVGDAVFGDASGSGFGAFAEHVVVPARVCAPKPPSLDFAEAAAVPMAATTALQGLRDVGALRAGAHAAVNGASGGVGTFAVQIAKALGAEVTAVARGAGLELVRSLGADHVVDSAAEDFAAGDRRYDVLLDLAGNRGLGECRRALRPSGMHVLVGGPLGRLARGALLGPLLAPLRATRTRGFTASPSADDLRTLSAWVEEGRLRPTIDSRYPLAELPAALRHLAEGHPRGKIVLEVAGEG